MGRFMEGRLDGDLAEGGVQVCTLAGHWSWAAGSSIMRRVAAIGGHAREALPYCIVTVPYQGGARRTVHLAQGINNYHLCGERTTVLRALGCSHLFSPADSSPQMCLIWPSQSVLKILNQLPTF